MSVKPAADCGIRDLRLPIRVHRRGWIRNLVRRGATPSTFARRLLLPQPEVAPIGLGARDSLRLEAGLCLYGHELDETVDPVEAALVWSIQKRRRIEGGFPGAQRIQSALAHGPKRRARRLASGRPRACSRGDGDRLARTARRSASSRPADSDRASARRSQWDLSRAISPRSGRRSVSSFAAGR